MKKETELTDFFFVLQSVYQQNSSDIFAVNMFFRKVSGSHFRCRKVLLEYRRVTGAVENYVSVRFYILFESMDLYFKTMLSLSNK